MTATPTRDPNSLRARQVAFGLLLPAHALLLMWISARMSPTSDEIAHLAAGVRYWSTGNVDLYEVNPPLVKAVAAAPVMLARPRTDWSKMDPQPGARQEWIVGRDFMAANRAETRWHFLLARWACLPFSLLGLAYCFWWAEDLFGSWAGTAAAACWAFSPNILGNAALLTPDVPAAALSLACLYHHRSWLRSGLWSQAAACGLFAGLAVLAKFTALLLVPWLLAVSLFAQTRWSPVEWRTTNRSRQSAQFALIVALSLHGIWSGYLYRDLFRPLGDFEFVSRTLSGQNTAPSGNRFRETVFAKIPVPLPASLLTGLDVQRRDFEGGWQPLPSYRAGQLSDRGWWDYYLYCLRVKAPLGAWGLAFLAAAVAISKWRTWDADRRTDVLLVLLPAVGMFAVISSQTGFSRYFRYVLPCFPLGYVLSGVLWSHSVEDVRATDFAHRGRRKWRPAAVLGAVLLCASAAESLACFPHQLAFFNLAAGGPSQGHFLLLDSNLDWGQDLYSLRDWQLAHPETGPLRLAYSGVADPALFEIEHVAWSRDAHSERQPPPPGWYAISANHLHGYESQLGPWRQFLERRPAGRAGYSLLIYDVTDE